MRKHDLQLYSLPEKSDFGGEAPHGSMILTLRQGLEEAPTEGPKIIVLHRASYTQL